jgi:hypothetical protein
MVDIKNYLSYDGLKLYDELIKKYIATADEAVLNQILGQLDPTDKTTIAELNDLIAAAAGTAGTALQQITVGTDGQFVTTTVTPKGEGTTQSVAVSVKTAALDGTEDGLVTASDARTELDKKVDKVEGKGLSTNDFTDDLKSKLDGIAAGAEVNYISSVGDNLAVDADGKLTVDIPEATVTGVDTTVVDGLKLELTDKKVTLVDAGLATTLEGKNVTVRKKADTTDDQCVYEILQGETVVGTINHPKEMVVTSGELVEVDGKQYLRLTIANQEEPVDIAVEDLVDVYTAGAGIDVTGSVVSVKLAGTQGNVVLDTTDGLKANLEGWETVKTASHTHDNKDVLDGITAEKVAAWDAKQDAMTAITDAEIEALFAEVTSL